RITPKLDHAMNDILQPKLHPLLPSESTPQPARIPKTSRQDPSQGVRRSFLQIPGPTLRLHVRAPTLGHRGSGRQSAERSPDPLQLDPAQQGQVAGRQAPRVAELGRRRTKASTGNVVSEASGGLRG